LLVLYGSEYFYRPVEGQPGSTVALDRNEIIQGELQVLQSTTLAIETLKAVGLDRVYPGTPVGEGSAFQRAAVRFANDLTLSSIPQSNILELSFRSYNPAVAADVLRSLISGYLERRIAVFARAPSPTAQTDQSTFLDRLHAAEDALSNFAIAHGIGNFDEQMRLLLTMQSANTQARHDNAEAVKQTAAKLAAVQQELAHIQPTITLFAESDRSRKSQAQADSLVLLQMKQRDMSGRYQDNYPPLQDINRQIASLQSQMAHEPTRESADARAGQNPIYVEVKQEQVTLQAELDGLQARQAQLRQSQDSIDSRVREFSQSEQEYRDLLRNRDVLDQTYRAFVRSNEDMQIADTAERSRAANIRVVQPPEVPAAGRNLGVILVAAGVAVGLIASVAALAVANALKQVFVSVRDASVGMELPVLISVPAVRRGMLQINAPGAAARQRGKQPARGSSGA
jgi:uncharacterized protein involved in exopolysaccharide biosynthesis